MIRTVLCLIILVLFLVLTIPLQIVIGILRKLKMHGAANDLAYFFAKYLLFLPLQAAAGVKLTVRGREYLPRRGDDGVLIVGNHCSFFDIVLSFGTFKTCAGYVGKKELGKVPLLGFWMLAVGCVFLDRENIRDGIRMANVAAEHIGYKNSMVIFPEGTRNKNEDEELVGEFHGGALRIAQKAMCKVIPMTISGSADILEAHFPIIKSRKVIIEYSEPIDTSKLTRPQLKALAATTRDIILKVRERHYEELTGKPFVPAHPKAAAEDAECEAPESKATDE